MQAAQPPAEISAGLLRKSKDAAAYGRFASMAIGCLPTGPPHVPSCVRQLQSAVQSFVLMAVR